jgi:UDP:flavonoid glycosyltransferase YjiC (YdhE family)
MQARGSRRRVLFVCEAVSLAQVARCAVLAASLDPDKTEVHFAAACFEPVVFEGTQFKRWDIRSITTQQVERAIRSGMRIHGRSALERYVDDEQRLFREIRPDVVIGDLRPSLSISAAVARVPYVNLVNAYWSPHAVRLAFPMPDHPLVRVLGVELAGKHFPRYLPSVLRYFASPVNQLRERQGLRPFGDLLEVMVHGDVTLHPDVPMLAPTRGAPRHHCYLGPVRWSARTRAPAWWSRAGVSKPVIYLTMGSTGDTRLLPVLVEALSGLRADVLVATAGRWSPGRLPDNVMLADYLPGDLACRRAAVVICNGGASTAIQALAESTPVLGIPFNLDQYLAMAGVEACGAGICLRGSSLSSSQIQAAVQQLLTTSSYGEGASRLASEFRRWDSSARFRDAIADITG